MLHFVFFFLLWNRWEGSWVFSSALHLGNSTATLEIPCVQTGGLQIWSERTLQGLQNPMTKQKPHATMLIWSSCLEVACKRCIAVWHLCGLWQMREHAMPVASFSTALCQQHSPRHDLAGVFVVACLQFTQCYYHLRISKCSEYIWNSSSLELEGLFSACCRNMP